MSSAGQGYGEGFFYTPEDQAAQQAIRQRQAYAQALLKGQQHQGQYGGLADAGSSIAGALLAKYADKDASKLATTQQEKMAAALKGIYQGNSGSGPSPQVSNVASGNLDPEGNPVASTQPQAQQQPSSFADRIAQSGDVGMMMRFLPQIAQSQLGREEKTWERGLPMTQAAKDQAQMQLENDQLLAKYKNGLPMTAEDRARLAQSGATLSETHRHNLESEKAAAGAQEFGKGMTGRAYNILAQGIKNPALRSTAEYQTAWQILSNPKVDPNTGTVVVPDLSAFAPPALPLAAGGSSRRRLVPAMARPSLSQDRQPQLPVRDLRRSVCRLSRPSPRPILANPRHYQPATLIA